MKIAFILSVLLIISVVSSDTMAQSGIAMMKVEPGARPAGLGGAFVSISGDPMSPIYNPAGAVSNSGFLFGTGYCSYWENISVQTGYAVGRISQKGFLFGGIRYAGVTDIEERIDQPSEDPLGEFSANDISFKGGLAWQVADVLAIGLAVGWLHEKIGIYSGSTFNFDLGLIYKHNQFLSAGASVTNYGDDFYLGVNDQQVSDVISVPKTYRFGLSYDKNYYLGALDLVIVDDKAHAHFGAEYETTEHFMIRAGYMSGYDSKNITAGGSIAVPNYKLMIDYAIIPYTNNLGITHQFNLTYGL